MRVQFWCIGTLGGFGTYYLIAQLRPYLWLSPVALCSRKSRSLRAQTVAELASPANRY